MFFEAVTKHDAQPGHCCKWKMVAKKRGAAQSARTDSAMKTSEKGDSQVSQNLPVYFQ